MCRMHFGFKPVIAADGDKRLWWSGPELLSSGPAWGMFRTAVMAVVQFGVDQRKRVGDLTQGSLLVAASATRSCLSSLTSATGTYTKLLFRSALPCLCASFCVETFSFSYIILF